MTVTLHNGKALCRTRVLRGMLCMATRSWHGAALIGSYHSGSTQRVRSGGFSAHALAGALFIKVDSLACSTAPATHERCWTDAVRVWPIGNGVFSFASGGCWDTGEGPSTKPRSVWFGSVGPSVPLSARSCIHLALPVSWCAHAATQLHAPALCSLARAHEARSIELGTTTASGAHPLTTTVLTVHLKPRAKGFAERSCSFSLGEQPAESPLWVGLCLLAARAAIPCSSTAPAQTGTLRLCG